MINRVDCLAADGPGGDIKVEISWLNFRKIGITNDLIYSPALTHQLDSWPLY